MNKIITPGHKSVLTPETAYDAYYKPLEKQRDLLFMGAIMHFAESVHESGEYKVETGDWQDIERPNTVGEATQAVMHLLHECVENRWNVAFEMLKWQKQKVAKRIKERLSGDSESPAKEVV